MDLGGWLRTLGLEQYEAAFRENAIDDTVLHDLTENHLREIGIPLGARLKLLKAIAALDARAEAVGPTADVALPDSPIDGAERRQVTVMFSDLVGSTALSARMDPEDLREVISAYQKAVSEVVRRFDGFVAKYLGDGVLVYFGYPRAHEDDAERAVRAGLELVAAVPGLKTSASLQARVGIATGLVVVGDLIGSAEAKERGIVGETPNLAARLQAIAEPNMVVVAESTRKLLGNLFELAELGTKDLKGISGPIRAWVAMRESSVESRFEALHPGETPLVGREEELELLLRRWSQAKAGEGRLVLLSGEPGIGKSRLTAALEQRLRGQAYIRLRYFCSPHHQDSALYPVIGHLERAAAFSREDTPAVRLDKLVKLLGTEAGDEDVSLLAELLAVPISGRYRPVDVTPQRKKELTLAALYRQLEMLMRRQSALMIFEDLHWLDPTSRELLDYIVERMERLPVLLIATYRPEFDAPWVGLPQVAVMTLNRLRRAEGAAMVRRLLTDVTALPTETIDEILDRTDGVPLFVEELTKALIEAGPSRSLDASPNKPVASHAVPTTLHASLLARIDRLGVSSKQVAQVGAAIGREFSYELLAAVAELSPPVLDDALCRLVAAGLVFQRGLPPMCDYLFKHALVQETAYSTLLRSRRQQLHARIADVLEAKFPEVVETQPELLARHCTEGGRIEKAVDYRLRSGKQAFARGAMAEAEAELRKGLDLLSTLPDSAARQDQELNLQIAFGNTLLATRGYAAAEAGEAFEHARQFCLKLNQPQQLNRVLTGEYFFRLLRGELEQAEFLAGELRRLGQTASDASSKYNGLIRDGEVCCWLGKFVEARAYFEAALASWDPAFRDRITSPHDVYVNALIYFSRTLFCLGYLDQARLRRDDALAEARRLSPYTEVYALRHAWYGDWAIEGVRSIEAMLRSAEHISVISSEQGFPMFVGAGDIMRGWCLSSVGDAKTGISLLEEGLKKYAATGTKLVVPFYLTVLAEAYGAAAQPKEGLNRIGDAAKLVKTTQERWAEAEMHRVRGSLLLSLGERAAAEESYCEALAVARHQSAKFWELRAGIDLGRLWRDQGKCIEARELLMPIYEWFTEAFDAPVLRDAKALLAELR